MSVAIVTGGSRGIGKAICIKLAMNKIDVVINFSSNFAMADEVVKICESYGVKAMAIKANISDREEVVSLVNQVVSEFGGIDYLINNAGITSDNLSFKMSEDEFDRVIDVNLKGTFLMCQEVSKVMMKKRFGRICNISSVVGISGNAGQVNYSASKAGIIGLSKSLAKELSARNINVNVVAPGFIETDMTNVLSEQVKANVLNNIQLKRLGKAEDIANAVYFLISNQADYITGQVLNVCGGMLI